MSEDLDDLLGPEPGEEAPREKPKSRKKAATGGRVSGEVVQALHRPVSITFLSQVKLNAAPVVITGGARGADKLTDQWAEKRGIAGSVSSARITTSRRCFRNGQVHYAWADALAPEGIPIKGHQFC